MNLFLLLIATAGLWRIPTDRWAWLPLVALSALSVELQLVTLTHAGSLSSLVWLNLVFIAMLLTVPTPRSRILSWVRALRSSQSQALSRSVRLEWTERKVLSRVLLIGPVLVFLFIAARGLFFVPESPDPYHLMKVSNIERTGTLTYVPVADMKINILSNLYESVLADERLIPIFGPLLYQMQGLLLFAAFGFVAAALTRDTRAPFHSLWLVLYAIPAVFHQFMLIDNDVLTLFVGLGALVLVDKGAATDSRALLAGWLAGLAMSVKATSFPVALATFAFVPTSSRFRSVRLRIIAAAGIGLGLVCGGALYHGWSNWTFYGSPLEPFDRLGNHVTGVRDSLEAGARFLISLMDLGVITRRVWPGRGGWGGNFGWVVIVSLVILAVKSTHDASARRAFGLCLISLLPFGLIYPDADVAHRMALAPGVFAAASALQSLASSYSDRPHTRLAAMALTTSAAAGFAIICWSGAQYLRQPQYLRSRSVVEHLAPATLENPVWRMRDLNRVARQYRRVAHYAPENHFLLEGVAYRQVAVAADSVAAHHTPTWDLKALRESDLILLEPNGYPPNPEATRIVNACLDQDQPIPTLTGQEVPFVAVACPARDTEGRELSPR